MINDIDVMDGFVLLGRDNDDLKGYREDLKITAESDLVEMFGGISSLLGSYKDFIISENPDSFWSLDDQSGTTVIDEIGVQNGTYYNTPTLAQSPAKGYDEDYSVKFERSNTEYILIPHNANQYGQDNVIIELWVKPTVLTNGVDYGLIDKRNSTVHPVRLAYYFYLNALAGNTAQVVFQGYLADVSSMFLSYSSVTINVWYHIVVYKYGTDCRLYINNVLQDTDTCNDSPINSPSSIGELKISCTAAAFNTLDGYLDNVAIYNGSNVPAPADIAAWVNRHYNWSG